MVAGHSARKEGIAVLQQLHVEANPGPNHGVVWSGSEKLTGVQRCALYD